VRTNDLARDVRIENRGVVERTLRRALGPLPGKTVSLLNRCLRRANWALVPRTGLLDVEAEFVPIRDRCAPYTMTSEERMYALWKAVLHIIDQDVPGALVECGVWRGGSSMLAAMTLVSRGECSRDLYLYDTFSGMSEPTEVDISFERQRVTDVWRSIEGDREHPYFAYASLSEVQRNMATTELPAAKVQYVQGKVEDTIPAHVPREIAVLRLDTDWYESTRHELTHLWPLVVPGGVIIIDDYGDWAGARQAVDEFFAERTDRPLLVRVDATGRVGIKR
jgi:O-methyltransferase